MNRSKQLGNPRVNSETLILAHHFGADNEPRSASRFPSTATPFRDGRIAALHQSPLRDRSEANNPISDG